MRYDLVTRDAVVTPSAVFSAHPDRPATRGLPRFIQGEPDDLDDTTAAEDEPAPHDNGSSETPAPLEDSVMPLFPDGDIWNDPDYVPDVSPPPLRGMVRLRLDEVARRRGLVVQTGRFKGTTNLSAIVRGTGLAYATVNKLLRKPHELTSISFEVLARLCEFFHCTPGDLLVWEPRAEPPQTRISDYFKRAERRAARSAHVGRDPSERVFPEENP